MPEPSKHGRVLEVHFYEWRLLSWATSDTRDRLDAAGRGIYRELLDQCYAKGGFPADLDYIQRKCACTLEEYERTWPIIKKQFRLDGRRNEYRNAVCDTFRRAHFSYIATQRNNGEKGGRPAKDKSKPDSTLKSGGLQLAKPTGYEIDNPTESLKKEIKKEVSKEEEKNPLPPKPEPSIRANGVRDPGMGQWTMDESYEPLIELYRRSGKPVIDEDFVDGWWAWKVLDFGQKQERIDRMRMNIDNRLYDDPNFIPKPRKFIESEWKRELRAPVRRETMSDEVTRLVAARKMR